jgi:uncharacterized MAPEG superfamily protein
MTIPLWCLTGFVAWTLLLVFGVISWRSLMVLRGEKSANEFLAGVPHGPDLYWRLNRAHLNAVENLPLLAAIVLVAHLAGVRSGTFDTLALVHLGARVVQTLCHLASNAVPVVMVRFTGLVVQLGCMAGMLVVLVSGVR